MSSERLFSQSERLEHPVMDLLARALGRRGTILMLGGGAVAQEAQHATEPSYPRWRIVAEGLSSYDESVSRHIGSFVSGERSQVRLWERKMLSMTTDPPVRTFQDQLYQDQHKRNVRARAAVLLTLFGAAVSASYLYPSSSTPQKQPIAVPKCMQALTGRIDNTHIDTVEIQTEIGDEGQAYTGSFSIELPGKRVVTTHAVDGKAYARLPEGSYEVNIAQDTAFSCTYLPQGVTIGPGSIDTLLVPIR